MLQHIRLDLFISRALLEAGHIHIFQRELHPHLLRVDFSLGKQNNRLNLRIAREKTVPLPQELTAALRGHFIGMLLVGEPGSGKTTLLRSIARELVRQQKILSVIDERRELFAGNAPGEALDVLAGLPKGQAVQMALRTLSPQVILLDELGGLDEVTALEQGLFSGVDFVATLHAATPEEATMRPQVKYLMERGAVRVLVWLTGRQAPGCIGEVRFL